MRMQIRVTLAAMLVLAVVAVRFAGAAPATWTGKISDAMCGMDKHTGDGTMAGDHDCVAKCVKGGSKYVFVADKKVYQIGNQDFAGLVAHAGHTVEITGEAKGDTITVSKIVMPKAK
jgi:hypothetical protein